MVWSRFKRQKKSDFLNFNLVYRVPEWLSQIERYQSVCLFVWIGSPQPLPHKWVCNNHCVCPPLGSWGGTHSLAEVSVWGEPIQTTYQKILHSVYSMVCPFVGIGSPHLLTRKRACLGMEQHLLVGEWEGEGGPNSNEGTDTLVTTVQYVY